MPDGRQRGHGRWQLQARAGDGREHARYRDHRTQHEPAEHRERGADHDGQAGPDGQPGDAGRRRPRASPAPRSAPRPGSRAATRATAGRSGTGPAAAWRPGPRARHPATRRASGVAVPGAHPSSRRVRPEPQASRPAVAATDSWKPMSVAIAGSSSSSSQTASPRAAAAVPGRPVSRATSATPPMSAARTTLALPPASSVKPASATTIATVRERRDMPVARSMPPTTAPTRQMFQPLMATTWLRPVVVKLSATSRATRSRRPTRMPDARPAIGSGNTFASAASAMARSRSAMPKGSAGAPATVRCVDAHGRHDVDAGEVPRELAAILANRFDGVVERDAVGGDDHGIPRQPGVDPPRTAQVPSRGSSRPGPPRPGASPVAGRPRSTRGSGPGRSTDRRQRRSGAA